MYIRHPRKTTSTKEDANAAIKIILDESSSSLMFTEEVVEAVKVDTKIGLDAGSTGGVGLKMVAFAVLCSFVVIPDVAEKWLLVELVFKLVIGFISGFVAVVASTAMIFVVISNVVVCRPVVVVKDGFVLSVYGVFGILMDVVVGGVVIFVVIVVIVAVFVSGSVVVVNTSTVAFAEM